MECGNPVFDTHVARIGSLCKQLVRVSRNEMDECLWRAQNRVEAQANSVSNTDDKPAETCERTQQPASVAPRSPRPLRPVSGSCGRVHTLVEFHPWVTTRPGA